MAKPTQGKVSTLKQIVQWIPAHLVSKLARKHGVDKQARIFTPWSHVVALVYAKAFACAEFERHL